MTGLDHDYIVSLMASREQLEIVACDPKDAEAVLDDVAAATAHEEHLQKVFARAVHQAKERCGGADAWLMMDKKEQAMALASTMGVKRTASLEEEVDRVPAAVGGIAASRTPASTAASGAAAKSETASQPVVDAMTPRIGSGGVETPRDGDASEHRRESILVKDEDGRFGIQLASMDDGSHAVAGLMDHNAGKVRTKALMRICLYSCAHVFKMFMQPIDLFSVSLSLCLSLYVFLSVSVCPSLFPFVSLSFSFITHTLAYTHALS